METNYSSQVLAKINFAKLKNLNYRVIYEDQPTTQEYFPSRFNIVISRDGRLVETYYG